MTEHVGVGGIGQRTIAFARFDTPAQLIRMRRRPDGAKIVAVLTQIPDRLGTDTAGPHIPIGCDLRRGDPRQAGNDLPVLHQRAFDNVIVAIAEGLGDARHPVKLGFPNALLQAFDHGLVFLDRGGDAHAHRIQLDSFLGNFTDKRVGLELIAHEGIDVLKLIDVEVGDDGMHSQGEVCIVCLERLQARIGAHGALKIAFDATHDIMFLAHPSQGQVDNDFTGWGGL